MSRRPRRNHSPAFKAKVATAALGDDKTIADIAHKHDVHPSHVTDWRRRLNVFVEWLWRSVKYEEVYLKAYDSVNAAHAGIAWHLEFYDARRPHQAHGGRTPDMVYFETLTTAQAAA
jgi:putative transposase